MGPESALDRRRKRVVEHIVGNFDNAQAAITFGNTVESLVNEKLGKVKFRQYVARPRSPLAITEAYTGKTVLKTTFLELVGDDTAQYICATMKTAVSKHNEVHRASVKIANEVTRTKPQPQYLG